MFCSIVIATLGSITHIQDMKKHVSDKVLLPHDLRNIL